ncbi:uncharacterized protein sS8_4456 [Methylocaldum marinum]|uniref:Uncharacterized protein n=1 Tax=Methylocaldum marinum TaxID=1432792 RepID=A0A250KXY5_9GAMM|nr:uncharacterized protein sS8_4456 [Methylocaldum marinum]
MPVLSAVEGPVLSLIEGQFVPHRILRCWADAEMEDLDLFPSRFLPRNAFDIGARFGQEIRGAG